MLIERRDAADAELAALLDAAFQELVRRYGPEGRSQVRAEATYLVACLDGRAAGCGALQPTEVDGLSEIKRMFVRPEHRGQGVASAVLKALEELSAEQGYTRIRLATGHLQPEAVALYEKHGYRLGEAYGRYLDQPTVRCYYK